MDPDRLLEIINQKRSATVLLTTSDGATHELEPGVRAVAMGDSVLVVMWPLDGDVMRVSKLLHLAPTHVTSVAYDTAA